MPFKMSILSILLCFSLTACRESEPPQVEDDSSHTPARQRTAENQHPAQELSCLEQCGQEARGTIYADCLAEGGDKQDCGSTGRQWYRECLETRCGAEAIQEDNCRTACRSHSKEEFHQCVENDGSKQEGRSQSRNNLQSCIAECQ